MIKALLCWSGGKDSALCLHEVMTSGIYDVRYLLTTINSTVHRISMHGVREELLEQQADSLGLALIKMYVKEGSFDEYEREMESLLLKIKREGIEHVIFGDIFLEDLRLYRENNLEKVGMHAVFPLWKKDTTALLNSLLQWKFRTITCCVNSQYLDKSFVGVELDNEFIQRLPGGVDPCGENGEYHTFCFDGPIFKKPINFTIGETIFKPQNPDQAVGSHTEQPGFWYCDFIPGTAKK